MALRDELLEQERARRAAHMKSIRKNTKGMKLRVRHRRGPTLTKEVVLEALEGTGAIMRDVAAKLGVTRHSLYNRIRSSGWEDIWEAFEEEAERAVELAERRIMDALEADEDLPLATQNARWLLERRNPRKYPKKTELTVQGGSTPLTLNTNVVNVDSLNLPVDVRRALLQAIESQQTTPQSQSNSVTDDPVTSMKITPRIKITKRKG